MSLAIRLLLLLLGMGRSSGVSVRPDSGRRRCCWWCLLLLLLSVLRLLLLRVLRSDNSGSLIPPQRPSPRLDVPHRAEIPQVVSDRRWPVPSSSSVSSPPHSAIGNGKKATHSYPLPFLVSPSPSSPTPPPSIFHLSNLSINSTR